MKREEILDLSPKLPSRPAWQELRDAERATNDLVKQSFDNQRHRETLKQRRILASTIDEYTHALDTIIKWAKHHGDGKNFSLDYYYFNFEDRMDDSKMLVRFLDKLKDAGCFRSWSRTNYTGGTRFGFMEVSLEKLNSYKKTQGSSEIKKTKTTAIIIKNVRLDEENYFLEINNGEKIIMFKSRKKGKGFEKETKQFKTLHHLWDFRRELKADKVLKEGDFVSLDNLTKGSGSKSAGAAYKHIQRLNTRFENEGVAIKISGENEKYRLIINKA